MFMINKNVQFFIHVNDLLKTSMLIIFSVLLTVHAMVMDCGINFVMFRIPDQVYCIVSEKQ